MSNAIIYRSCRDLTNMVIHLVPLTLPEQQSRFECAAVLSPESRISDKARNVAKGDGLPPSRNDRHSLWDGSHTEACLQAAREPRAEQKSTSSPLKLAS